MEQAIMILDRDYAVGEVDKRLYGSFLEHLGRAVYGGIYEPTHPTADENGFRRDVLNLVRQLGISVVRYPGGNFVSGFNWEDSVGPRERRPARLDLAWLTTETNEVGLHEFMDWCRKADVQPMYAVNLGTRGPDAAREVVEYCNHPAGTRLSDLRIQNGAKEPFDIKLWCLGNEMDGPWQICAKTAVEYGRVANEAAKLMKWVDPSIELVACGTSVPELPTFGTWEYEMLSQCYDNIDYVSLHRYYANHENDTPAFLANTLDLENLIHTVTSVCDAVGGTRRSRKRLNLAFDEWNVWYHSLGQDQEIQRNNRWGRSLPLLEDVYNFEDALLVGGILITFLKHADRVKIACLAQLVNAIAPIMTQNGGPAWAQTIFYPMMHASRYGRGTALRPVLRGPVYDCRGYEHVPCLDAAATVDGAGNVTIFAVNRGSADLCLAADLRAFGALRHEEHILLHHDDPKAVNTCAAPDTVAPRPGPGGALEAGRLEVLLPAMSWNVLRLAHVRG